MGTKKTDNHPERLLIKHKGFSYASYTATAQTQRGNNLKDEKGLRIYLSS